MKNYRIVKDNFLGYEAQVRYNWLPFVWFQMNDFYWINTWPSEEHARQFIASKKMGELQEQKLHTENSEPTHGEFEKEAKLLLTPPRFFNAEVVWQEATAKREKSLTGNLLRKKWWDVPALNG